MITARIFKVGRMVRVNMLNGLNEVFDFSMFRHLETAHSWAKDNGAEKIYFD